MPRVHGKPACDSRRERLSPVLWRWANACWGGLPRARGNIANGLSTLSQARRTLDVLGWQREAAYVNVLLADVLTLAGRWPEAMHLLDETLRTSARSGVAAFDACLHVRKAIVFQNMSDNAAAEHEFVRAVAVACTQSAKLLELQACNGLARLMLQQGRTAEARRLWARSMRGSAKGWHSPICRRRPRYCVAAKDK